jgi:hypothetical protein
MNKPDPEHSWFERRANQDRIFHGLLAVCGALLVAEFTYQAHPHFAYESWFAFHAAFGFAAYVAIVTTAKGLRRLVRKSEDYYRE